MMIINFPIPIPADCEFGLQNIPWGIFSTKDGTDHEVRDITTISQTILIHLPT